jgi:tripeptide aminopeptidase
VSASRHPVELAGLIRTVLSRTEQLAVVPAPTGAERERAELVAAWWAADGLTPHVDELGNVWAQAFPGDGPALLLCAHLDTVFPAGMPHRVEIRDGLMRGPGVGDDTVGVAALSAVASQATAGPAIGPLWLLATVGEEGIGNLAGIRYALQAPPQPIAAVIAIEGNYLGRVVCTGVGSARWRVSFEGPGGHAWERASAPSAVHAAASAAAAIARLGQDPSDAHAGRRSANIGMIGGGEAINARARGAWFEADLRADAAGLLAELADLARAAVAAASPAQITATITDIGSRPAGQTDQDHPLVRAAVSALERVGWTAKLGAASTDANAAYAAGIPAVTLGVTCGEGEHTPQEWIETGPVGTGLAVLADTVTTFWEASP